MTLGGLGRGYGRTLGGRGLSSCEITQPRARHLFVGVHRGGSGRLDEPATIESDDSTKNAPILG